MNRCISNLWGGHDWKIDYHTTMGWMVSDTENYSFLIRIYMDNDEVVHTDEFIEDIEVSYHLLDAWIKDHVDDRDWHHYSQVDAIDFTHSGDVSLDESKIKLETCLKPLKDLLNSNLLTEGDVMDFLRDTLGVAWVDPYTFLDWSGEKQIDYITAILACEKVDYPMMPSYLHNILQYPDGEYPVYRHMEEEWHLSYYVVMRFFQMLRENILNEDN